MPSWNALPLHRVMGQDLFDDIVTRVVEPLRDLRLTRREVAALFWAMITTFPAIPQLNDKNIADK
jgi:hypothetical protein